MKVNKRELILISILVIVLTFFLFYQYIFVPQLDVLAKAQDELEKNEESLAELRFNQEKQQEYLKEINENKDEIAEIQGQLPNELDLPRVMMEIYDLTIENSLAGDRIIFSEVKKENGFDYYTINISVNGNKKNIDKFINKLENYKRQISIESISIEPSGATDFEVDFAIRNYILKSDIDNSKDKNYDFMGGKYGTLKEWYDMFKYQEKQQ